MKKIYGKKMSFWTEDGKQFLFNGINVVCKEASKGYIYSGLEESFRAFREMGFNLIRFGIFWDGVEPAPGKYDWEYLDKVKKTLQLAEQYGLYVIVDMHQDLYARKYLDGAPDWATLDEGAYHPENCTSWYEAYLQSEAIMQAADHFWANTPAEDGIGLLDHYGNMWGQIARYLNECSNIIGWEPLNEPYMGSLARNAFGYATMKIREKYPDFDLSRPDEIPMDAQIQFMQYVTEQLIEFDRTTLMDFYRRIQKAVVPYSNKPIVTGGNIYSSSTVTTGIERLDCISGEDLQEQECQIYAPHGYDSAADYDRYECFSKENVERLYADKYASQQRLQIPLIVGEWGAFPSKPFANILIRNMNNILEKYLWSSTYWGDYCPGWEKDDNFRSICRAYPVETAGKLISYHYDEAEQTFEMEYEAEENEVTKIYCPFIPNTVRVKEVDKEKDMTLAANDQGLIKYDIEKIGESTCYLLVTSCSNGVFAIKAS